MAETVGPRMTRTFIQGMAKHLPPSASQLRLLDIGGLAGTILAEGRPDLEIVPVASDDMSALPEDSADAIVGYSANLNDDTLKGALNALRPGGRLILLQPQGEVDAAFGETLEMAGYTRILVEAGMDCPVVAGVLMRGEKPHVEERTVDRIKQVAERDEDALDLAAYNGRYIHLLIKQSPDKPAWKMEAGETVEWEAVTVGSNGASMALAFSSLPKAVSFMQTAVMAGKIKGVSKIAKFHRDTAQAWPFLILLNPSLALLDEALMGFIPVDVTTAEAPDE
jgi:hypothetical protein